MKKFYFGEIGAGSKKFCSQVTFTKFMNEGGWRLLGAFLQEEKPKLPMTELRHELLIATARALNAYDTSRVDCKLTTYVWESWRNVVKMAYRRGASLKEKCAGEVASLGEEHEGIADTINYEDFVLDRIEKARRIQALRRVLDDSTVLTTREKTIIKLTLEGLPQKEIGKETGSSQSEVSKNYRKALAKLREALMVAGIKGA